MSTQNPYPTDLILSAMASHHPQQLSVSRCFALPKRYCEREKGMQPEFDSLQKKKKKGDVSLLDQNLSPGAMPNTSIGSRSGRDICGKAAFSPAPWMRPIYGFASVMWSAIQPEPEWSGRRRNIPGRARRRTAA